MHYQHLQSTVPCRLRNFVGIFILLLGLQASTLQAEVLPFGDGSMDDIVEQRQGQPFTLLLWSIFCAPCFAELAMLGEALAEDPALPVVLIATDGPAHAEEVGMVLEDYGLAKFRSWQFAEDFPEKLRYQVDPDWFGELPRSYHYQANHQRQAHSGVLSRAQFMQWQGKVESDRKGLSWIEWLK